MRKTQSLVIGSIIASSVMAILATVDVASNLINRKKNEETSGDPFQITHTAEEAKPRIPTNEESSKIGLMIGGPAYWWMGTRAAVIRCCLKCHTALPIFIGEFFLIGTFC